MTTWFILGCYVESELDVQEQEVNTGQETGSGFHCREIMASKGLLYATSICPELGDQLNWGPVELGTNGTLSISIDVDILKKCIFWVSFLGVQGFCSLNSICKYLCENART